MVCTLRSQGRERRETYRSKREALLHELDELVDDGWHVRGRIAVSKVHFYLGKVEEKSGRKKGDEIPPDLTHVPRSPSCYDGVRPGTVPDEVGRWFALHLIYEDVAHLPDGAPGQSNVLVEDPEAKDEWRMAIAGPFQQLKERKRHRWSLELLGQVQKGNDFIEKVVLVVWKGKKGGEESREGRAVKPTDENLEICSFSAISTTGSTPTAACPSLP